ILTRGTCNVPWDVNCAGSGCVPPPAYRLAESRTSGRLPPPGPAARLLARACLTLPREPPRPPRSPPVNPEEPPIPTAPAPAAGPPLEEDAAPLVLLAALAPPAAALRRPLLPGRAALIGRRQPLHSRHQALTALSRLPARKRRALRLDPVCLELAVRVLRLVF